MRLLNDIGQKVIFTWRQIEAPHGPSQCRGPHINVEMLKMRIYTEPLRDVEIMNVSK